MSQADRVLSYLERGNSITTLDAFKELGITRLGARIFELRQQGHPVQSNRLTVTNRFGEDCSISEYYIGGQSNG
jgi:hypothetical protein